MKIRINEKNLLMFPPSVRSINDYKKRYKKNFIDYLTADSFYTNEDSTFVFINMMDKLSGCYRTAGEFSGLNGVMPCTKINLDGVKFVIQRGFSCGVPYMDIVHNTNKALFN